ncbi:SHOCT domain-containing protein [Marinomonas sp. A79]|uniref:SHOCT domain-containing protein n=1 Tax=Marinomonas vulgaris TaxID=2823372 RepID=A0ABS5HDX1_9GAMM|nr:SHOCT domain-containing protein [Marinomonas vulgaris]MBR7889149.1 SHOCT domain-containing protein [Marinomonas vulgaris]
MQNLTQDGQQLVNSLSSRYNLSHDAVMHMLIAVNNGSGSMAQFNCPELGGGGQWMRGGMTMVGDMFNYGLKSTVDNLCNELANGLASMQVFAPLPQGSLSSNQWWPGDLGQPFSSGAQNSTRYAIFPNRLAVDVNGSVTVYDTLDNNIGGIGQQQGGNDSLTFSSQYGTIAVNSLPVVSGAGFAQVQPPVQPAQNNFMETPTPAPMATQNNQSMPNQNQFNQNTSSVDEVIQLIEKLAKLRDMGAISENEYNSKKIDLLNRI